MLNIRRILITMKFTKHLAWMTQNVVEGHMHLHTHKELRKKFRYKSIQNLCLPLCYPKLYKLKYTEL